MKAVYQLKFLEEHKMLRVTSQMMNSVLHWLVRTTGHSFGINVVNEFGAMLREKKTSQTKLCIRHCSHTFFHDIPRFDWVQFCCWHEGSIAALHAFFSKPIAGNLVTAGQNMNCATFSNLQFRPLLETYFHSIQFDSSDTSAEKISFLSVGITLLVMIFRKTSYFHF